MSVSTSKTKASAAAGAAKAAPSSNWKALRKTMPISVAAQEMTAVPTKKRKREHALTEPTASSSTTFKPEDFVRGFHQPVASIKDVKGKGKARDPLLGEEGVSGYKAEVGQYVSLDCEFVGLYDPANNHSEHSLARVSIVNYHGAIVLDTFVAQREKIGDWRTWVSGVRPQDVKGAPTYEEVQKKVADIIKGRILVGHAVHNDLKVLLLSHPHNQTRDTASYGPLRELAGSKRPSLKTLAKKALGLDIQEGEHSSVTDARATMAIYRTVQRDWEAKLKGSSKGSKKLKVAKEVDSSSVRSEGTKAHRKEGGARVKGGPGGGARKATLGLAATLSREKKDWWSSGTIN